MANRRIIIKHQIFLKDGKDSKVVGRLVGWDGKVYIADLETDKGIRKISATTHKGLKKIVNAEFNWTQDQDYEPKKRGKRMSMAEMKELISKIENKEVA